MVRPCVTSVLFAFALFVGAAFVAQAQGLPGGATSLNETHGNWQVNCHSAKGAVHCAISQTQVRGENRQRVIAIELSATGGDGSASGALVLPFGLKLDAGVSVAIDDNVPLSAFSFSTCLPAGCLVPLSFDAATVTALKSGTLLNARATANDGGQEVAFSISLSGFTSALDRVIQLNGA